MKVSDYIIKFLVEKGVTDIFGYPGGSINHLIDSASKEKAITAHLSYNEQGAAFAACGYAQASGKLGVAYSTSGPGATNLVTGIANAYYDYIPALFITGQVDSPTAKGNLPIRQRGFQETDVISLTRGISKLSCEIKAPDDIKRCLEQAFYTAFDKGPGPVVLDIPNDIQRAEISPETMEGFQAPGQDVGAEPSADALLALIEEAERPVLLFGNGVKLSGTSRYVGPLAEKLNVPALFSLPAVDILPHDHKLNYGFIGGNGQRYANEILKRCDLLAVFGNRFSMRQIGAARQNFIPQAKIIRVDIDANQLDYHVRDDETSICADLREVIPALLSKGSGKRKGASKWLSKCQRIKEVLQDADEEPHTYLISDISGRLSANADVTVDVGQNLLWTARSFRLKAGQRMFMSAGHGAMGYSIPAAIGVYYAAHRPVYAFCGDGGFMMNLQELQFIKRNRLPIKIFCLNNRSLGMIRSWQGRYLERFSQTTEESGYQAPDLEKIAAAFDMQYTYIAPGSNMGQFSMDDNTPAIIEICLPNDTETMPNGSIYQQQPGLDESIVQLLGTL